MEREAWGRQVLEKHRLPIWQLLTVHENCRLSENLSNDNKKKNKGQVPNTLTWICLYYSKPWLLSKCRNTHCFSMTLVVMMSNWILVRLCLDKPATVLMSTFDLHFDFKSLDMSKSVWKIGRKRECIRITILYISWKLSNKIYITSHVSFLILSSFLLISLGFFQYNLEDKKDPFPLNYWTYLSFENIDLFCPYSYELGN